MALASQPLSRCPVCRYSLSGLPPRHRCPECGFEYDEAMQVLWMPAVPQWMFLLAWFVCFTTLMVRFDGLGRQWFGLNRKEVSALSMIVSSIVPLSGMFLIRGFVALGRDRLSYRFPLRPVRSFSWSQLVVEPNLHTVFYRDGGVAKRLWLPTVGLPRKRRRIVHAEIARRWRQAVGQNRRFQVPCGGLTDLKRNHP